MDIHGERGITLGLVAGFTQPGLDWTPDPDIWSAGEILHHVAITEAQIARVIKRLATGRGFPADRTPEPGQFRPDGRPIAPRSTWPERGLLKERLLGRLAESQAALEGAWRAYAAAGSPDLTFPHPFFGDLRARSWLKTQAGHERHHRDQIERLRSREGFPADG